MASDSTFYLPPHFLSDHDNLPPKPTSSALFPTDFPYDFTSSSVHSPVDSVLGDDDNDDEQDFLAALTQRLTQSTLRDSQKLPSVHKSQAKMAMAGSPQSTLSGVGSWSAWSSVSSDGSPNGPSLAPSPPTTPFGGENNTWDLIYAAAGQVARLKMNTHRDGIIGPSQSSSNLVSSVHNAGLYSHPSQFGTDPPIYKPENSSHWGRRQVKVENQQIHYRGQDFYHENERFLRPLDITQSAWPSLHPHHRSYPSQPSTPAAHAAYHGVGSAPKKECAGTGVFLPRRYDNNPPQSRRRADSPSVALVPAKNIQGLNGSIPPSNRRLQPSYDALIAQRNTIFAQQRLSYPRLAERSKTHEFLLPQEWTY
ncbi:WAS/WASL-interacting protein family member 2, putative isoform 1 [Cucumis melo var. makuwa]|nr:WAS/WASL-interacting protein family member 2, putative isoform 1 [Cucumis melo var. makuwa]TYK21266.1 WAS/WASL-interacting protein family member 2, putative isoform 1 [Cucumis melo var. makuwa]